MELSIGFTNFTFSLKSHTLTIIKNKLEIGRYAEGKESYWMKVHPDMDLTIQEWEEKRLGKLFFCTLVMASISLKQIPVFFYKRIPPVKVKV